MPATTYTDGGIIAGSTDVSLIVPLPAQTTSATAGLKIAYTRSGAAAVTSTAVANTATGVHTDWSIVPCDPTNIPELHRIDLPDAAFAVGADLLTLTVSATAMVAQHYSYPLRQPVTVFGTVVPGTLEVTTFTTSVPNTTNQLARRILEFTSGPNAGQRVAIVGNDGAGVLQVAPPLLAAPTASDGFVIL
jgi:hypothetical protein